MTKDRVLNPGAYGFMIKNGYGSHIRLFPHWMSVSLDYLYEKAVEISATIPWEAEVTIYADGFIAGTLRGRQ